MRSIRFNKKGFTLLELLMVVIIIGILAAVALPQYFRVVEHARTGQVLDLIASIRGSQLRFKANNPANLYDVGAMGNIDLAATAAPFFPVMPAWNAPAATAGGAAGSNVSVTRNGGPHTGKALIIDLDSGNICSDDAPSSQDWGVLPPGC